MSGNCRCPKKVLNFFITSCLDESQTIVQLLYSVLLWKVNSWNRKTVCVKMAAVSLHKPGCLVSCYLRSSQLARFVLWHGARVYRIPVQPIHCTTLELFDWSGANGIISARKSDPCACVRADSTARWKPEFLLFFEQWRPRWNVFHRWEGAPSKTDLQIFSKRSMLHRCIGNRCSPSQPLFNGFRNRLYCELFKVAT